MTTVARLSRRVVCLAPLFSVAALVAAIGLLFALPIVKVTNNWRPDENGMMTSHAHPTPARSVPAEHMLPRPADGSCFVEVEIVGLRAPLYDAFYVVANAEHDASLSVASIASREWQAESHRLASDVVIIIAANTSCIETGLGYALDPSRRVKAAVIVNVTEPETRYTCLDSVAAWGTQPNHDLVLSMLHSASHNHLFACPEPVPPSDTALGVVVRLASSFTSSPSAKFNPALWPYFQTVKAIADAFLVSTLVAVSPVAASLHPLSVFRLGVAGYPPAVAMQTIPASRPDLRAAAATSRAMHAHHDRNVDMLGIAFWGMNAMNERLHHSFSVYFPLSTHHWVENNAAQLQALLALGGICIVALAGWRELPAVVTSDIAVVGATAMEVVFVCTVAMVTLVVGSQPGSLWICAVLGGVSGYLSANSPWLLHDTAAVRSARIASLCGIALAGAVFVLSALSPAASTTIGVPLALLTWRVPQSNRVPNRGLRTVLWGVVRAPLAVVGAVLLVAFVPIATCDSSLAGMAVGVSACLVVTDATAHLRA